MSAIVQIMAPLKEAGAAGALVLDPAGRIIEHTMPSFFPVASLAQAGERVVVFFETLAENFEPIAEALLEFDGYVILVKRSPDRFLAVIMAETANREAVKMATNIVFRRLGAGAAPPLPRVSPLPLPVAPSSMRAGSERLPPPPAPMSSGPPGRPAGTPASPPRPAKPKKKNDIWGD